MALKIRFRLLYIGILYNKNLMLLVLIYNLFLDDLHKAEFIYMYVAAIQSQTLLSFTPRNVRSILFTVGK